MATENHAVSILGVGELLVDAVFVSDASRWRLQEVRGGGSVWNVIANAADAGAVCTAFAAAGGDWRSKVAEADLKAVGVPTRAIRNERRVTPSIFLVPTNVDSLLEVPAWRLTPKCPVCERTQTASKAASLVENGLQDDLSSTSIVCVDRISGGRLDVARAAQAAGCSTAVDIGHRGYVRYLQRQRLEESLSLFDLIQAPVAVASMICNRLEIEPVDLSK
ncbi:MAG: hypothetical protein JWR83_1257, partial [Aeromicrobium sp.]|nr:hypothetical protein [Aeromicrobium sp.]